MSRLKKLWQKVREKSGSLSAEELKSYEEATSDGKMEAATKEVVESLQSPSHKTVFKILLSVLLVASIVIFVASFMRYSELQKRKEILQNEVDELELEIEELQYLIGVPKDDYDYMVRMAKEKLGLYFPDETIYYNDINK